MRSGLTIPLSRREPTGGGAARDRGGPEPRRHPFAARRYLQPRATCPQCTTRCRRSPTGSTPSEQAAPGPAASRVAARDGRRRAGGSLRADSTAPSKLGSLTAAGQGRPSCAEPLHAQFRRPSHSREEARCPQIVRATGPLSRMCDSWRLGILRRAARNGFCARCQGACRSMAGYRLRSCRRHRLRGAGAPSRPTPRRLTLRCGTRSMPSALKSCASNRRGRWPTCSTASLPRQRRRDLEVERAWRRGCEMCGATTPAARGRRGSWACLRRRLLPGCAR